jgi:hypothetical protein
MTPEEAAERILLGVRWVNCPNGDENGSHWPKRLEMCQLCKGYATILDPKYEAACKLLGRSLPERTGKPLRPETLYMSKEDWDDILCERGPDDP